MKRGADMLARSAGEQDSWSLVAEVVQPGTDRERVALEGEGDGGGRSSLVQQPQGACQRSRSRVIGVRYSRSRC
jgi:hypothetical protein